MSGASLVVGLVIAVLAVGLAATERGRSDPRRLAVIAALAAAATAGRVLFAAVPSVKPVTLIAVATGVAFGARSGFAVGALAPLLSNMALGQGPWTPAQMALWGLIGASGAWLAPICRRRTGLAAVTFVWGWVFGWAMNLWDLATFGPQVSVDAFLAYGARSVSFDAAHAVGNVVFALVAGPALIRLLIRYRDRIAVDVDWDPAGAPGAAAPRVET